jgi:aminocarboxymuconate-semialdehyde decarboxylase
MGIIIDGFAHILPKTFLESLSSAYATDELRELATHPKISDTEDRVRILDKYKIDKQVLTLARPSIWINMPQDLTVKMTRMANEALAKEVEQFPDRLIAVGTLPVPNEALMPEFDYCIQDLGMMGIQIFSNIEGKPLDDPEFRLFFSKANSTKTPIWIHPQLWPGCPQDFALDRMFAWPFDTSLAMARLVFSGIMEEYPDLRIVTHHMGGMIPHFSERIKGIYETREAFPRVKFASLPEKDALEYFRRFYADTVLNGAAHALECGLKFFGSDQVIFATDYPYGPEHGEHWVKETLHQIKNTNLSQAEKGKILGENLQSLFERY